MVLPAGRAKRTYGLTTNLIWFKRLDSKKNFKRRGFVMDDMSMIAYVGILAGAWLLAGIGSAFVLAWCFFGWEEKNLEDNEDDL